MGINPNELTGKKGLERIMDFVDSQNPPEKGSFKYKESVIEKYGRIFSKEEIGKYSSKIKNILDNIVSNDGVVSEGVILIYSQYIDGGVIPIALALEEMGFTRYGDNVSSLFKDASIEPIDFRTMKPRIKLGNGERTTFIPAKYSMITGDPRISPNNSFEMKALTNEDNKDGQYVKIVLVTQAGSEGLDYKFLRQVHIMEPWYNMSRIEQLIGRAVRNFSHKILSFEKRNVEIFMYGTILENNKEESADLYVYRSAEKKAVQIGFVSRVLKETAVDCILNHEQVNFSQENISSKIDNNFELILPNKSKINYKIGDIPFSATCDYMESCSYKCYPDKDISKKMVKDDSYNESFIVGNSEKIIKKIKFLMKERFFYIKKDLIKLINPITYPLVQIYSALTQLIEDKTEYIVDKYGRTGYLINIDEYYLFQPSELSNKSISVFDRSVPIDYKHQMIELDIKQDITRPVINSQILKNTPLSMDIKDNVLYNEIKNSFDTSIKIATTDEKFPRGSQDWYNYCGLTMKKIMEDKIMTYDELCVLLMAHILDLLLFPQKVELLNYIYSLKIIEPKSMNGLIKDYFVNKIINFGNLNGILLFKGTKLNILKLENSKWIKAEPEDEKDILNEFKRKFKPRIVNRLLGFIDLDNKKQYLTFKIKETNLSRYSGSRCDESNKNKKINILNEIFGFEKYTKDNTSGMVQFELCSLIEFLMRHYDNINKDNKLWFMDTEMNLIMSS